mmetsp:Transcript_9072/g.19732  ORF Transcript_9072/g.19732 Transcript_9072/m.19732 type:complete len:262 (+) Transcript_9072:207-992(+)
MAVNALRGEGSVTRDLRPATGAMRAVLGCTTARLGCLHVQESTPRRVLAGARFLPSLRVPRTHWLHLRLPRPGYRLPSLVHLFHAAHPALLALKDVLGGNGIAPGRRLAKGEAPCNQVAHRERCEWAEQMDEPALCEGGDCWRTSLVSRHNESVTQRHRSVPASEVAEPRVPSQNSEELHWEAEEPRWEAEEYRSKHPVQLASCRRVSSTDLRLPRVFSLAAGPPLPVVPLMVGHCVPHIPTNERLVVDLRGAKHCQPCPQ